MSGRVAHLCASERQGIQKTAMQRAKLVVDHGIEGDAHAGTWHRQVSLLDVADIEMMRSKGLELPPGAFAENVGVSGLDLGELGLGSRLRLGTAELEISQIGKACHNRCVIYHTAGDCIMPRRGLFARVITTGEARCDDPVEVLLGVDRQRIQAVVLSVTDAESAGQPGSSPVERLLTDHLDANVYRHERVPNEKQAITTRLLHYGTGHSIDVVAVAEPASSTQSVASEAVRATVDRPAPALAEALRGVPEAACGVIGTTLVVALPATERDGLKIFAEALLVLSRSLSKIRGGVAGALG